MRGRIFLPEAEKIATGNRFRKHGASGTRTYVRWTAMKQRCYDPNYSQYVDYGGRGIRVCDRWLNSFENFLADMGECPPGMSLDRFPDNDGNYEPGNCRWATRSEQNKNRRLPTCSLCGSRDHNAVNHHKVVSP